MGASGRPTPSLTGRRVVVTRRAGQSSSLARLLRERGATVLEIPAIEVKAPADTGPLDLALAALEAYDWVAFTSANAVRSLKARIVALGLPPGVSSRGPAVASVGPATTEAYREAFPGERVALEPEGDFRAAGLLLAFERSELRPRRVLLPLSSRARDELMRGLRRLGASVDAVVAYETVEPAGMREAVGQCLSEGFDVLTFASPSAVEGFVGAAGPAAKGLKAAVIGPTTGAAAAAAGLEVVVVAPTQTAEGLVTALNTYFG